MILRKNTLPALFLAGASSLTLLPVLAQAEPAADETTLPAAAGAKVASADTLEEVVVLAEKREMRLQSAPLSITAIGGDQLQQRNINELNDLNGLVPGLTSAKSEGSVRVIAIRGIGYETQANPNSQPGVAFHINGVYIAHVMSLSQDLLDVDRVEVLRGPQGTVFGQTSTGGAINVITHKPELGEASASAQVSYGNFNYVKAAATGNLPISDTIAARGSVQYFRHDGYGHATNVPGDSRYPLDDADNLGARASLLWKPSDTFSALLSGQTFDSNHNGALQKNVLDLNTDPREVTQDFPAKFDIKTRMADLTLSQQVGQIGTLKTVTAYQHMDKNQTQDTDRLADPSFYVHTVRWRDRSQAFTQELQFSSFDNGVLNWTMGAFYLRQHALKDYLSLGSSPALTYQGMPIVFATYSPYQHTSIAGFGQATWHATDALDVTGGARYSWDETTGQPINFFNRFGPAAPRRSTSDAFTGKLGVERKLTPVNMVYVTGSRGYKPSGVNFNQGSVVVPQTYDKEIVNALEIGTKNDFSDGRLRLNVSGYHYWYDNYQYTAEDPRPNSGGSANIPHARIYGAEFEASVLPMDGLRFDGTLSLARGRFEGNYLTIDSQTALAIRKAASLALGLRQPYVSGYGYNPGVISAVRAGMVSTDGNDVPKLPGIQGSVSASYSTNIASGQATVRGEMIYRGHYTYRIFNNEALDRVPSYTLFNVFLRYVPNDSNVTYSVSAQNLFDKNGINSLFTDPYGAFTTSVEYVPPRQVFGTVSIRF
jgi:iron complex outermembrane receptor protein